MRNLLVLGLAAIVCLPFAHAAEKEKEKEPAKTELFTKLTYDKAIEKAKTEKKVVLVDFTAEWCGWCKVLDEKTFSVDKVQKVLKDKTIPIKVDFDNNKKLVEKYNVKGIPCLIFVDGDGKEVGRIVGYKAADKWLEDAVKILDK